MILSNGDDPRSAVTIVDPREHRVEPRLVKSWDEFVAEVRKGPIKEVASGQAYPDRVLYRGQSKPEWPVWAPLDRTLAAWVKDQDGRDEYLNLRKARGIEWYDSQCALVLSQFRALSSGLPGVPLDATDEELWAIGRHYGLLTPLLDWTLSPYVAAYFAFADRVESLKRGGGSITVKGNQGFVRIWALAIWSPIEVKGEFEILRPRAGLSARQRAQSGVYTTLRSWEHLALESYLKSRGLEDHLVAYDLPIDAAAHALRDLELMNILPATLFPDLQGAATQANMVEGNIHWLSVMYDYTPPSPQPLPPNESR